MEYTSDHVYVTRCHTYTKGIYQFSIVFVYSVAVCSRIQFSKKNLQSLSELI